MFEQLFIHLNDDDWLLIIQLLVREGALRLIILSGDIFGYFNLIF
jgi:endonuclease V-like protein UPF0215 family